MMKSGLLSFCFFMGLFFWGSSGQLLADEGNPGDFNRLETGRYLFNVFPEISEVSSSVYDRSKDMVWVLGDSGTGAIIGRRKVNDDETDVIDIAGAENIDWEAMVLTDDNDIWILDVGDNQARRENLKFYRVDPDQLNDNMTLDVLQTIDISYPAGPMDVEGAVFKDEKIYLFEKVSLVEFRKAKIWSVDVSEGAETVQTAKDEGLLPVVFSITDASISPEGILYLLTYYGIFECYFWQEDYRFSLMSKFFFLGQQESMTAMGNYFFLVGVEAGYFYRVKKWFPLIPF